MTFTFAITGVRPAPATVVPTALFGLRIGAAAGPARVHALALRVQVQIETRRRQYTPGEQDRLYEVFGRPSEWDRALKPLVWTQTAVLARGFTSAVEIDLPVPCTYDFDVAAAKYLHALRDGDVPLRFLFSGTAFLEHDGAVSVAPVAWDSEAAFRMPAARWREVMDAFFPDSAWIRVRRETLDALHAWRGRQAAPDWDTALAALLQAAAKEPV